MFYYKLDDKILFSSDEYKELIPISEDAAEKNKHDVIYFLNKKGTERFRRSFSASDPSLLFLNTEDIYLLQKNSNICNNMPGWILDKISRGNVTYINTSFPNWDDVLKASHPKKWNINLIGLGDVGGMLLTGLRLLGSNHISKIGIYSRSLQTIQRWEYEMNQVLSPFTNEAYPEINGINESSLFDCDMFVFCASRSVPPVGTNVLDIRMEQFKDNSEIISKYAMMARNKNFKGIFAVVSDPVDLLCKVAFLESNKNEKGELDYNGIAPEQIRGYGLGVMNARAVYYSKNNPLTLDYAVDGRAFGPHGEGLIIANSIKNYNCELSDYLTEKAKNANIDIRKTGFKPYIAPALSSGALSILATIKGDWHYSATYMGGVFIGCKNRLTKSGTEIERLELPPILLDKLKNTYERLEKII